MSERLVTEADLIEPVCECGHGMGSHDDPASAKPYWPSRAYGCIAANPALPTDLCECPKDKDQVRLAHLDSIVRREVARELRDIAHVLRGRNLGRAAQVLGDRVVEIESGGQS